MLDSMIDYAHDRAFAATAESGALDRIVGVRRYEADAAGTRCECAVVVSDDGQGKGLGLPLMKHLIEIAKSRGIAVLYSIDSAGNGALHDLARFLGLSRRTDPEDSTQVIHELTLRSTTA